MLDFINDDSVDINMTSLKGKTFTTYDKLVEVFGEPTFTDASPYEKVNAQWTLEFKIPFTDDTGIEDFDTVVATIYNWKDGYIPTDKYDWHIGGYDFNAFSVATDILDNAKKKV